MDVRSENLASRYPELLNALVEAGFSNDDRDKDGKLSFD